jgi:uncharacterized protein DUF3306
MSEREAFLARWSRRKREAAGGRLLPEDEPPPPASALDKTPEAPSLAKPDASGPTQPASRSGPELPPIDTIDAGTDIRAFLKPEVPPQLARAALRRAWSSDPAIRDFVGLSENAWDFNAPDGVPGFGPFAPGAARELVARVLGEAQPERAAESAAVPSDRTASRETSEHGVVKEPESRGTEAPAAGGVSDREGACSPDDTAMQQEAEPSFPRNKPGSGG